MSHYRPLADALGLTDEQLQVVERATTSVDPGSGAIAASTFVSANHIERASAVLDGASVSLQVAMKASAAKVADRIDAAIASNERLAASADRHSERLLWLTWALVLVGVAQVVATAVGGF